MSKKFGLRFLVGNGTGIKGFPSLERTKSSDSGVDIRNLSPGSSRLRTLD